MTQYSDIRYDIYLLESGSHLVAVVLSLVKKRQKTRTCGVICGHRLALGLINYSYFTFGPFRRNKILEYAEKSDKHKDSTNHARRYTRYPTYCNTALPSQHTCA